MMTFFFTLFSGIDGFLRGFLPLWAVLVLWGLMGGAAVMGLYALLSRQKRIRAKKEEIKQLQSLLKDDSLDFSGTLRLSKQNLMRSLELLGLVLFPSLLSMLPALCMIFFVSMLYSFQAPEAGQDIKVKVVPQAQNVRAYAGGMVVNNGKGGFVLVMGREPHIVVYKSKRLLYKWTPGMPMDSSVGRRPWWGFLAPEGAGFLPEDSEVEEIRIGFKALRIIDGAPRVLGGWEFTYLLALAISAVLTKVIFRIE
jgi:hypothetical protein